MYYLYGLDKNLETIAVISKKFVRQGSEKISLSDLKQAFFDFTRYVQPNIPNLSKMETCYVDENNLSMQLAKLFIDSQQNSNQKMISGSPFKVVDDKIVLEKKFSLVRDAFEIHQKNSHEYHFLMQLIFSYIFIIQSESVACATIPHALGVLLLDHREWDILDIREMLIHETAHQLVTLDEHRYDHYVDMNELNNPENYAVSAIRKTKRPLNKVIHSLIVAYEILAYRKAVTGIDSIVKIHPKTSDLIEQINETIRSINMKHTRNLLTPRASSIVDLIENNLRMCL